MNTELRITNEQIIQENKSPTTVLHLRGWLDAQSEIKLISTIQDAITSGANQIVLDLEEISMLTSAGIRSIQKSIKLFSDYKNLKICNAPPDVYHVLKITGLLQILPMYESLQAAIDA